MNSRSTSSFWIAAAIALCGMASPVRPQAVNHPLATLVVNHDAAGSFPLQALMGQTDPGVIAVSGAAGAGYVIVFGQDHPGFTVAGLGTIHIQVNQPVITWFGTLDSQGEAIVPIPAGALNAVPAGATFTVQAIVADPSQATGYRASGATQVTVAPMLSGPITSNPAAGSVADMRGPVSQVGASSVWIGNVEFITTPLTVYSNVANLAGINPGDWIVVDGEFTATGQLRAKEINVENAEPEVRIRARIRGLGPSGFDLLNVSVYTSTSTTYTDFTGVLAAPGYADLTVGMIVEVRIPVADAVNFPHVSSVLLNAPTEPEPEPEPEPPSVSPPSPPVPFCS